MRIDAVYSHLNGLEFLEVRKKGMWDQITSVIESIDGESCRSKVSKERGKVGRRLLSPKALNRQFEDRLCGSGWSQRRISYWMTREEKLIRSTLLLPQADQKRRIEEGGGEPLRGFNQTDFVKDRVAIEVQFGKYAFVAYDLFVKHLAFYVRDEIDLGIEILPMKSMQQQMSSGPGCYEGELYNVIRNGRGVPAVPLVLVGIVP